MQRGLPVLLMSLFICSCSNSDIPPIAEVSGLVTKNGTPAADISVTFYPEGGRPSLGTTDATGKYTLQYKEDLSGAVVGTHTVMLSTGASTPPPPPPGGPSSRPSKPPAMAKIVDFQWPEPVTVEDKKMNEINFELK